MCDDREAERWIIVYSIVVVILMITMIPICYVFVTNYRQSKLLKEFKNQRLADKLFCVGFIYLIESFICLPGFVIYTLSSKCYNDMFIAEDIIKPSIAILYGIQLCIMEIIWFMRLYITFKGSVWALNKCTFMFYIILNVFGAIILFPALFSYHWMDKKRWLSMVGLAVIFYTGITISFAILFIVKLAAAHKKSNADKQFIETITKITLLAIVTILITIVSAIIGQFRHSHPDLIYVQFAWYYGALFDGYSNVLCIMLSYNSFNFLYFKLCGFIHSNCNKCWIEMLTSKDEKQMIKELQISPKSNSPKPVTSEIHIVNNIQIIQ